VNLNNLILREIGALSRSIQTISDINFKELDLQKGQFIYLTRICENPGINQIALSDMLKVDKTTTTKAVNKLENQGYVVRKKDQHDGRAWRLYPNQKAIDIYPIIIDEENQNIDSCFQNFSDEERDRVYQLVKKMRENIQNNWEAIKNHGRTEHD
jgi:DNA-binding MarR family transcriptional regulator